MDKIARLETSLARVFLERLHVEVPSPDIDLFETGVLDSMGFVELLLQLEQEFGLRVALDDLEIDNFRSLRKIAGYVAESGRTAATASV